MARTASKKRLAELSTIDLAALAGVQLKRGRPSAALRARLVDRAYAKGVKL